MIQFTVPGVPVAQPRQRHGIVASGSGFHSRNYLPKSHPIHAYKQAIQLSARQAWRSDPLSGPLKLLVEFYFPRPKSMLWKRRPMPQAPKTSKPDVDNCLKAVLDACNGILWNDDAQVYWVGGVKLFVCGSENPCTDVFVLDQNELLLPVLATD